MRSTIDDDNWSNKLIVLKRVREHSYFLKLASIELKNNHKFILVVVEKDGRVLDCAPKSVQSNKEVVMTAIKQNGSALQ